MKITKKLRTLLPLLIYYDTSIHYYPIVFYIDEPIVYEVEVTEGEGHQEEKGKVIYESFDSGLNFDRMFDEQTRFEEARFHRWMRDGDY